MELRRVAAVLHVASLLAHRHRPATHLLRLKLGQLEKRLKENHRMAMEVDPKVIDAIAERCTEVETGARNVDHIISGTLLPKISSEILQQMSTGVMPDRIAVKLDDKGDFAFEFSRK